MTDAHGNVDISVIIPVFNTELFLEDCIESVIASGCFTRCEVLLVNDGSQDGSEEIMQSYAQKYSNIRCLTYECAPWNRGLSAARNLGVENASGKYLFFLDSDDAIQPEYLEKLYRAALERDCEIIYAGFSRWNEDIQRIDRSVLNQAAVFSGCEFVNRRMDVKDNHNYVWCALYRATLFHEKGLSFDNSIRIYEDIVFSWRAASIAERVSAIPEYGYLYRVRSGSLVQNGIQRRDADGILSVLELLIVEPDSGEHGRFCFMVVSMLLYYVGDLKERGIISAAEEKLYFERLSALNILPRLRRAATTNNERLKWLIWKVNIRLFYPIVKKSG